MDTAELLVALEGAACHRSTNRVGKPPIEILGESKILGVEGEPAVSLSYGLPEFLGHLLPCAPVDALALGAGQSTDRVLCLPTPVFALLVGPLAADPFPLPHAQSSLRFFARSANASTLSGSYSLVVEEL